MCVHGARTVDDVERLVEIKNRVVHISPDARFRIRHPVHFFTDEGDRFLCESSGEIRFACKLIASRLKNEVRFDEVETRNIEARVDWYAGIHDTTSTTDTACCPPIYRRIDEQDIDSGLVVGKSYLDVFNKTTG